MNLDKLARSEALDTLLQNHPGYEGAKNVANMCDFNAALTLAVMEGYTSTIKYAKEETRKGKFIYFKIDKVNILTSRAELTRVNGDTASRNLCWLEPATEEEFNSAVAEYEASKASKEQEA